MRLLERLKRIENVLDLPEDVILAVHGRGRNSTDHLYRAGCPREAFEGAGGKEIGKTKAHQRRRGK